MPPSELLEGFAVGFGELFEVVAGGVEDVDDVLFGVDDEDVAVGGVDRHSRRIAEAAGDAGAGELADEEAAGGELVYPVPARSKASPFGDPEVAAGVNRDSPDIPESPRRGAGELVAALRRRCRGRRRRRGRVRRRS